MSLAELIAQLQALAVELGPGGAGRQVFLGQDVLVREGGLLRQARTIEAVERDQYGAPALRLAVID
jgi:hypothetical protein